MGESTTQFLSGGLFKRDFSDLYNNDDGDNGKNLLQSAVSPISYWSDGRWNVDNTAYQSLENTLNVASGDESIGNHSDWVGMGSGGGDHDKDASLGGSDFINSYLGGQSDEDRATDSDNIDSWKEYYAKKAESFKTSSGSNTESSDFLSLLYDTDDEETL